MSIKMQDCTIYTRVYSPCSAGATISGKLRDDPHLPCTPMSEVDQTREFLNHNNRYSNQPTGLVSVSDRIVDTLSRAFEKHHQDGESATDIWIMFVQGADGVGGARVHSAKSLAKRCGLDDPSKRCHEWLFEWAIPSDSVLHRVCLQTLIDRGLPVDWFAHRTSDARGVLAEHFQGAVKAAD